jgi:hypothetical protein
VLVCVAGWLYLGVRGVSLICLSVLWAQQCAHVDRNTAIQCALQERVSGGFAGLHETG